MLRIVDSLPSGLLEAKPTELEELLGGPTLIHLPGRRPTPLFISVLLHGNEITGFEAVQELLSRYCSDHGLRRELPRSISLLIGNVAAARYGLRRLDAQPDYNRVWPGGRVTEDSPERRAMCSVFEEMRQRGVFASVDVHNNTGVNPHYACVNRITSHSLQLAALFSRTVVYFVRPDTVQSNAFATLCPAVTLECGQSGKQYGTSHALDYLDACLHLAEIPNHPVAEHDLDLFHTVATVKVPAVVEFGIGCCGRELCLANDLDHMNFTEIAPGTVFGRLGHRSVPRLNVVDERGRDVYARYFEIIDGELRTRVPTIPSMLTLDERVIRQDCLCYFMERYPLRGAEEAAA